MSKVKVKLELDHPTVVVQLTPVGLKITLEAWQHNAPTVLLANLDLMVQKAVHEWRGRFIAQDTKFGTASLRERDATDERQANRRQS